MTRYIQSSIDEVDKSVGNLVEDFSEYIVDKSEELSYIIEDLKDAYKECDWDSIEYEIANLENLCKQMGKII